MTQEKSTYSPSLLETLFKKGGKTPDRATLAYAAMLDHLQIADPLIARSIKQELEDQRQGLKLIASENYSSLAVQMAMGNWLTDKYAEGFPGRRFYAGCENIDAIEALAASRAVQLFNADHAFVQPHCGADANLLAFMAVIFERVQLPWLAERLLKGVDSLSGEEFELLRQACLNPKLMGMSLNSGGHLTHGYRLNLSARLLQAVSYEVDRVSGLIDYDELRRQVKLERPLILLAGYSAYPRRINFAKMRSIADEVDAILISDMAHFAGLVAGKVMQGDEDPVAHSHIVTSTTHKTLRGPRGGLVLCKKEFASAINKACPLMMGGPLPHVMAAKAIAFKEALESDFKSYAQNICDNAKHLADCLIKRGHQLVTSGTDNHLMIINVEGLGLNGKQAEYVLRSLKITVNRNAVPFDKQGPWLTSGVRLGTAALTTLGMGEVEMEQIADWIDRILRSAQPSNQEGSRDSAALSDELTRQLSQEIDELKSRFPLYPEIPSLLE